MKYAPDFHPFQILSLVSIQFIGLNGLSISFKLIAGDRINYSGNYVEDIVYLGIIYLSLLHIILYYVFFLYEKKYYKKKNIYKCIDNIRNSTIDYGKWSKYVYLIVWGLRIINFVTPIGVLGASLYAFVSTGYQIVLFLLLFAALKKPNNDDYIKFHWIVVVIEILLVLGNGMKEEMIKPLIPYTVYLIFQYKAGLHKFDKKFLARLVVIGLFVVGFVFPYVSIFRTISNETGKSWNEISIGDVFSGYIDYLINDDRNNNEIDRSTGYVMSRAGSIIYNAWAIDYAQNNGSYPQFFTYCSIAAIPRVIWPSKPVMVTGGMTSRLINGDPNWFVPGSADDYGSSSTLGFMGSCYLSFGFVGAIILIIIHALFLSYIWNYIRNRLHYNLIALFLFVNLLFLLVKDFESFKDCGVGFVAMNTAYLLLAHITDNMFKRSKNMC